MGGEGGGGKGRGIEVRGGSVVAYWFWGEGGGAEREILSYTWNVACIKYFALAGWFGT